MFFAGVRPNKLFRCGSVNHVNLEVGVGWVCPQNNISEETFPQNGCYWLVKFKNGQHEQ